MNELTEHEMRKAFARSTKCDNCNKWQMQALPCYACAGWVCPDCQECTTDGREIRTCPDKSYRLQHEQYRKERGW